MILNCAHHERHFSSSLINNRHLASLESSEAISVPRSYGSWSEREVNQVVLVRGSVFDPLSFFLQFKKNYNTIYLIPDDYSCGYALQPIM